MNPPTLRTGADRCPGALQPFAADDGLIVRARIPGGEVEISALRELMQLAVAHGAPWIQLTTRANLQIRGLDDPVPTVIAERMADVGLLPSLSHERARNILAAPTAPRLRARARELDRLLQARPTLAALPGRFLMLLTDESGFGLTEPYDLAYVDAGDGTGTLLAGDRGRPCPSDAALEELLDLAEQFLAERGDVRVWNIRDLPADSPLLSGLQPIEVAAAAPLVPGPRGADLVAGVPLGMLEPAQLAALGAVADAVVVTPWRSLLVAGGAEHAAALAASGLVTTADSPWARISACPGAPYCARAMSETLQLARDCAAQLPVDGPRLHLVGCERRCGHPRGRNITVVGAHTLHDVHAAIAGETG